MTQPGTGEGAQSGVDPNAQSGGTGETGTTEAGAQSGAAGQGAGTEGVTTAATTAETVSKADFDRAVNQLRAADQKRTEAETALKQLRDKDLPEAERLKRDFETVTAERDKLTADLQKSRIENAFLKQNKYTWQDPEAALLLADMSSVAIDAEGTVTGLEDALKRLANAKPWMLVNKSGDGEGGTEGKGGAPTTVGTPPMNGQAGTSRPDANKLADRFPALRTRQRPKG